MVLSMERWVGKVAIVTGASSGIGAAISELLVKEGLQVVGLARRKKRIDALAKKLAGKQGILYAVKVDLTKEEEIVKAFQWVKDNLGPVHILINSAGVVPLTTLNDGVTEKWQKNMDVHVIALCITTREAVKDMRKNNVDGHIIHINSIGGHEVVNYPYMNIGAASKHAVTALTETLRLELNSLKSKIKITSVSPGAVDTGIIPYIAKLYYNMSPGKGNIILAEDIADAVLYVLSTPPHVQIQELTIRPVIDFIRP